MSTFNSRRCIVISLSLLVASLAWLPPSSVAQTNTASEKSIRPTQGGNPTQNQPAQVKKARPIPFHGTLASVSPSLRTITVGKRTFQLTADTKIYRGDNKSPGALSDARVGGNVTGSYFKNPDGKLLAKSVYFKPAQVASPAGPVAGSSAASKKK